MSAQFRPIILCVSSARIFLPISPDDLFSRKCLCSDVLQHRTAGVKRHATTTHRYRGEMAARKGSFGGYDEARFEKEVDNTFYCAICQKVLEDPVQCKMNTISVAPVFVNIFTKTPRPARHVVVI